MSAKHFPDFLFKPCTKEFPSRCSIRLEARKRFLKKTQDILSEYSVDFIAETLKKYGREYDSSTLGIIYLDYKKCREELGRLGKKYLTTALFAKLYQNNPNGMISIKLLISYLVKKIYYEQIRINLSLMDSEGNGYINEDDIETFFLECVMKNKMFKYISNNFKQFYICHATQWLVFFLDPNRTGRIQISTIIFSTFAQKIYDIQNASEKNTIENVSENWFSVSKANSVYAQYMSADLDGNGMLSQNELQHIAGRKFTKAFIARLTQTNITYDGEYDYKAYLQLILAYDYASTYQALKFFFQILDTDGDGFISDLDICYFFKDIQSELNHGYQYSSKFNDVALEIYDIVLQNRSHERRFNLKDLVECEKGSIIVKLLIDVDCFLRFESSGTYATY